VKIKIRKFNARSENKCRSEIERREWVIYFIIFGFIEKPS
jgi:hypothetical protein